MGHYVPRVTERRFDEAGPGGRSSNAGITVAVFGAGGFLGRYLCSNLGTNGVLTYVGNRGDDMEMRYMNPMFDLGRLKKVFYSPRDVDSMKEVIGDADVVINLIGKHYETKTLSDKGYHTSFSFHEANVDIPRTVAELCTEMQVDNLIHVSCMSANPDSSSEYARKKFEGELAVKEAYPWATIVRPTQLFGPEDKLLNWFANAVRQLPFIPMIDEGKALTQPVYVTDVADVISRIVDDPADFEGKTVDCFGSDDFTYAELAAFVYDITGQDPRKLDLPKSWVKAMAQITKFQPYPFLTPDQVELWSEDCIQKMSQEEYDRSDVLTMKDFRIKPTQIEKVAFNYLHRFRTGGHFIWTEGYQGHVGDAAPSSLGLKK